MKFTHLLRVRIAGAHLHRGKEGHSTVFFLFFLHHFANKNVTAVFCVFVPRAVFPSLPSSLLQCSSLVGSVVDYFLHTNLAVQDLAVERVAMHPLVRNHYRCGHIPHRRRKIPPDFSMVVYCENSDGAHTGDNW